MFFIWRVSAFCGTYNDLVDVRTDLYLFCPPACYPAPLFHPSSYCLPVKAQAADQLTAAGLSGPPGASALCAGCQINEVFAFLWLSCSLQKVIEGGFPVDSELC